MDRKITCVLLMSKALSYEETVLMLSLPEVERPLRIPFDLNAIDDSDVWEWFRFTRENIPRLKEGFGIPDVVSLENKSLFDGVEILCILLGRLAYPSRYTTLKLIYRRSKPELLMAFSWIVGHVESKFGHLLTSLVLCWLTAAEISLFCKAVRRKGAPLRAVWGFIDGSFRPCCRPKVDQKTIYSGHYRLHGLKFQSVMAPNGLVVNLDGPWPGRRHDSGMLAESGLLDLLKNKMAEVGAVYRVYGDPTYPISEYLEAPFRAGAAELSEEETDFNKAMAEVRIAVEWGFGEVIQQFAFLDYSKNLKILWQPVGTLYTIGTLLTNCRVCLGHAGKVSDFFGVAPPSLEQYLKNQQD